jgi:hypothetical protein
MYLEKEMECAICLFHRDDQQVLHCSISTQFGGISIWRGLGIICFRWKRKCRVIFDIIEIIIFLIVKLYIYIVIMIIKIKN